MSDGWVIDPGDSNNGPVYELYRDGQLVMSCGEEFYKALMNHPEIKAAHEKLKEVTGND